MKITNLILKDYKAYKLAGYSKIDININKNVHLIVAANGYGKALANSAKIKVPGTWSTMGEMYVGKVITAWDGVPTIVTGVYPQGKKDIYELEFNDNRTVSCDLDHLWKIGYYRDDKSTIEWEIITLRNILEHNLYIEKDIFINQIISEQGADTNLLIPPYTFGTLMIKSVPQKYLYASHKQRLELLQGLMDTNGTVNLKGKLKYHTASKQLAKDVQYLVRSLGGLASITNHKSNYIVNIDYFCPNELFTLPEKKNILQLKSVHKDKLNPRLIRITYKGKEECQCITIDHPDKLFITNDFIVTHNSSTLRAMDLSPSKKSDFGKKGLKEIKLTHDNDNYVLTSDFTEKGHVHSFVKNDTELNIAGLSTHQEELIEKELGITPFIIDLLFNRKKISRMGKSDRKAYLLNICPFDLTHFLILHKKTLSKVRYHKNNLKMLSQRKSEIESKLAEKSILEVNSKRYQELLELKSVLDKVRFTLTHYINQYTERLYNCTNSSYSLIDAKELIKKAKLFLFKIHEIDTSFSVNESQISQLQNEISKIENNELFDLIKEIETYTNQLDNVKSTENISEIELEQKIKEYKTEIEKSKLIPNVPFFTSTDYLERFNKTQCMIENILDGSVGYTVDKIITISKLQHAANLSDKIKSESLFLKKQINKLEEQYKTYNEERSAIILPAIVTDNCNDCRLFNSSDERRTFLSNELNKISVSVNKLQQRLTTLDKRIEYLNEYYRTYIKASENFYTIQELIDEYKLFSSDWLNTSLKQMFLRSPRKIAIILDQVVENTNNKKRLEKLEKELLELISTLDKLKVTTKTSKQFLETMLKDKLKQKENVDVRLSKLIDQLEHIQKVFKIKQRKKFYLDQLQESKQKLHFKEKYTETKAILDYYKRSEEFCNKLYVSINKDLTELEVFLSEQHSLTDRYNNEILPLLEKAKKEKDIYEELEMALSPSNGIPYKYLADAINNYIVTVNSIISKVWEYELKLEPIKITENFDFIFPMSVGGEIVEDISNGSDGQQCIINFAWNIAAIMGKNLTSYPIFLDEPDRELDYTHQRKFLELLKSLLDTKIISQLNMISHHALMFDGFNDAVVTALSDDNIVIPEHANEHVRFE